MSEEKSKTRQGLICAEMLPLRVLLPSAQRNNLICARDLVGKPVPGHWSTLQKHATSV